ncbi:hypothetical protein E2C01_085448 [Portunus trituberculatus]|uniref:Uncharacterized protein n=1 Tax=Portunus trituberculatus TaxID=210409 RepID=A0A5B7J108_PORTR|nr:hypothetical protein [Portunus trituberculatus]
MLKVPRGGQRLPSFLLPMARSVLVYSTTRCRLPKPAAPPAPSPGPPQTLFTMPQTHYSLHRRLGLAGCPAGGRGGPGGEALGVLVRLAGGRRTIRVRAASGVCLFILSYCGPLKPHPSTRSTIHRDPPPPAPRRKHPASPTHAPGSAAATTTTIATGAGCPLNTFTLVK